MLHGKNIIVVMPAYHAEKTLAACYAAIPHDIVDEVLLVDDASDDATAELAERLGIHTFRHPVNRGYGGNQKTCYALALERGADIVVMLHPDYQYEPRLITAMAAMVASDVYDVVIGSRILGSTAIAGGMPRYKYIANRFLTAVQNLLVGSKLSEFHTGYRAFSRRVLETLPLARNSDDFVFDNQMLVQALAFGLRVGELSCPTRYFAEASQINFRRSVVYGCGVLWTGILCRLWKWKLAKPSLFSPDVSLRLKPGVESASLTRAC
jgi:glycosyltransferase involved in cell wall biosynthesis